MRALMGAGLLAFAVACSGCAGPVALRIKTDPPVSASVHTRLIDGKEAANPAECQVPCSISIPPSTKHEIVVRSSEYYPAAMDVSYEQIVRSQGDGGDGAKLLVVPLQHRPSKP